MASPRYTVSRMNDVVTGGRLSGWRQAVESEGGNITRASLALDLSRRQGHNLNGRFKLQAFAANLRKRSYGRLTDKGRPPTTKR